MSRDLVHYPATLAPAIGSKAVSTQCAVVRAECACRRSDLDRVRFITKNSAEDERTMILQKVVSVYTSPALGVNSMWLQHTQCSGKCT